MGANRIGMVAAVLAALKLAGVAAIVSWWVIAFIALIPFALTVVAFLAAALGLVALFRTTSGSNTLNNP